MFISPFIRVDCADGPRFILRKPEKAFSIVAVEWDVRIKAVSEAFAGAKASTNLETAKRLRSIVESLDKNYAELQAHYHAVYLNYCANPCDKEAFESLSKANSEIRRNEFKLRLLENNAEHLIKSVQSKGAEREAEESVGFGLSLTGISTIMDNIEEIISSFRLDV